MCEGLPKNRGRSKALSLLSYQLWKQLVTKHVQQKPLKKKKKIQYNHDLVSDTIIFYQFSAQSQPDKRTGMYNGICNLNSAVKFMQSLEYPSVCK